MSGGWSGTLRFVAWARKAGGAVNEWLGLTVTDEADPRLRVQDQHQQPLTETQLTSANLAKETGGNLAGILARADISTSALRDALRGGGAKTLTDIFNSLQTQREIATSLWTDDSGAKYVRRDVVDESTGSITVSFTDELGNPATPGAGLRPLAATDKEIVERLFVATAGGTGYAADDVLARVLVIDTTQAPPAIEATWMNVTAGTIIGTPTPGSYETSTDLVGVKGGDGATIASGSNRLPVQTQHPYTDFYLLKIIHRLRAQMGQKGNADAVGVTLSTEQQTQLQQLVDKVINLMQIGGQGYTLGRKPAAESAPMVLSEDDINQIDGLVEEIIDAVDSLGVPLEEIIDGIEALGIPLGDMVEQLDDILGALTGGITVNGPVLTGQLDRSAFLEAVGRIQPIGGVVNDTTVLGEVAEDVAAAARITPRRAIHVNLRSNAGTEIGTAAAPVVVSIGALATSAATPVPVPVTNVAAIVAPASANRVQVVLRNTGANPVGLAYSLTGLTFVLCPIVLNPGDIWIEDKSKTALYGITSGVGLASTITFQEVTSP
jgi:hypothetical protein